MPEKPAVTRPSPPNVEPAHRAETPALVRVGAPLFALLVLLLTFYNTLPYAAYDAAKLSKLFCAKAVAVGGAYLLAGRVLRFVHRAAQNGLDEESGNFLAFFVICAAWFGFWLLGLWPGFYMTDSYGTLWSMYSLSFDNWFSALHPLLYLALYQIVPNAVVVPIFQLLLTSLVFAYALAGLRRLGLSRFLTILLLLALLVNVPVIALTLLVTRDTVFSVVLLFFALWIFFRIVERERAFSGRELCFCAALIVFLAIYRGDGIALLLAVPLLLGLNGRISTPRAGMLFLGALLMLQIVKPALIKALAIPDDQKIAYSVSLMMNPLGYLLQNDYVTATPEQDRKVLGMLVDVDKVKEVSIPYEIPAFWSGYWKPVPEAAFSRVRALYGRMIMDNKALFLANRLICFSASTGMRPYGFTYCDMARDTKHAPHFDAVYNEPLHRTLFPALYQRQAGFIASASTFTGLHPEGKFLHWNFLPELALALLALALFPWFPATASTALVVLSRVPLVFLAAPAGQFKYYYSLYLFGFFVIFLLIAERKGAWARKGRQ
ncbi:hypothetical protein KOM00_13940 [Geomonas sp. Red69]|uniref:Glycosyltransferase RgtA/B/C/D-like domain-containing protein n=1 Tax=Geomonas diazotrophica TaxID=2843197 RepID=A0ABX8JGV5_9BACT|nr:MULTISPECIES: hypothetical protein [Geomonas]MBU5637830.1 hypothetical protein [Geomonas diazotrophica]QWV96361.1 hypothetical protein KP005_13360 [Geomonas nitrogeniifigens]